MRRALAATALATGALLAVAAPAWADAESEPVGVVGRHDDGTQSRAVQISGLYPTATRQVVFLLDGETPADVRRMRLSVHDLADRENDCVRPEGRAGDTTCGGGADQGELSAYIELTLTAGRLDGDACTAAGVPVATTLRALADEPATVGLPGTDGTLCVIGDLRHAEGPGDDVTQSDSSRFDLRMDLDAVPVASAAPGAASSGVTIRPAGIERAGVVDLGPADPGFPVGIPLVVGGVLLGCGALFLFAARRAGVPS
jgi:hypothetical protein